MMKKTVFWGVGTFCRAYLDNNAKISPAFFIDSNYFGVSFYDRKVVSPESISDWQELFVIIMCKYYTEIVDFLTAKGLKSGTDFITYDMLCENRRLTYRESLEQCREFADSRKYPNVTLLFISIFTMRESGTMIKFLAAYQKAHKDEQCVILTNREGMDASNVIEKYGCDVIDLPVLSDWRETEENREFLKKESPKQRDESEKITEILYRKAARDPDNTRECLELMYEYYEQLFVLMKPGRIVLWEGWTYKGYVIGRVAAEQKIPIGYMEFGWIPGTYQLDREGIQGQGEYAKNPRRLLDVRVSEQELAQAKQVKAYVVASQRDTGVFHYTAEDEEQLSRLSLDKTTVFVAGMDDEGMGMNPESEYWQSYVSHCFKSSKEMVTFIYEICRRNSWNLIFKPHPHYNKGNLLSASDLDPGIILVKDRDVDSLIQMSSVMVCMASAVEYKALMYGKPVVPVGRSAIQGKKCAYEVRNRSEIEMVLREAVQKGMTEEQRANFDMHLAQLLKTCLWDDLSERDIRYGLPVSLNFFEEERV